MFRMLQLRLGTAKKKKKIVFKKGYRFLNPRLGNAYFQMSDPGNSDISGTKSKTWVSHLRKRDLNFEPVAIISPRLTSSVKWRRSWFLLHGGVEGVK